MAYFRCMGNGGSAPSPSSGSMERLFYASENSIIDGSVTRHTDHVHIAYFDDGTGTITEDTNYSQYLSYNHTTKKFEVLEGFTALIFPWVYEYEQASSSTPKGAFYINDVEVTKWLSDHTRDNTYAGIAFTHEFSQGDTFYYYTPSTNGYPEANLKVYKIDSSVKECLDDVFDLPAEDNYFIPGIGNIYNNF